MVQEFRPGGDVARAVLVVGAGVILVLCGWVPGARGALVKGAARDDVGSVCCEAH